MAAVIQTPHGSLSDFDVPYEVRPALDWLCAHLEGIEAEDRLLKQRIDGLPCSSPDKCPGPELAHVAESVCSVCLFRAEVLGVG